MPPDDNNNGEKDKNQSRDLEVVLKRTLAAIGFITVLALVFLGCLFSGGRIPFALGTYLLIAGALFVSGGMLGFLFGIPKIDKTISSTSSVAAVPVLPGTTPAPVGMLTSNSRFNFSDNANLEEISDWLTKIIVGLTLVQFNNIKKMLDEGAKSINRTLELTYYDFYVFGYAMIIFYLVMGFLVSYFWTRTNYVYILEKGKGDIVALQKENIYLKKDNRELEIDKAELKEAVQQESSLRAVNESNNAEFKPIERINANEELEKIVLELLRIHEIKVGDDPQKGRWGGLSESNSRKLEAVVTKSATIKNFYDVKFTIRSTDSAKPLNTTVVLLLHDSFGKDIVYLKPENNRAEITLPAYEAFTAAAICDNGTTFLELDLNNLPGNPPGFNY